MLATKLKETQENIVTINAPKTLEGIFSIQFTAPYVSNAFTEDAKKAMRDKQSAGGSTTKRVTVRAAKDFNRAYEQSMHVSTQGWRGIPVGGFMKALTRACVLAGYQMTRAKMAIRVVPDGFDKVDNMGLARITKGEPRLIEHTIPNANGQPDIRVRAMWDECELKLRIRWDADQFDKNDIGNLIMRAGEQVGVGAGRPFSENGPGCGWGTFKIAD